MAQERAIQAIQHLQLGLLIDRCRGLATNCGPAHLVNGLPRAHQFGQRQGNVQGVGAAEFEEHQHLVRAPQFLGHENKVPLVDLVAGWSVSPQLALLFAQCAPQGSYRTFIEMHVPQVQLLRMLQRKGGPFRGGR